MPEQSVSVAASERPLRAPALTPARMVTGFLLLVGLSIAWAWQPLATVVGRSLRTGYENYSYVILLPVFSAYLVFLNRRAIFADARPGPSWGIPLAAAGATAVWLAGTSLITVEPESQLSLAILGVVILWAGAFGLCCGPRALKASAFPFLLLLFMAPFPPAVLDAIIVFLQKASSEASAQIFALIGMPTFREGDVFHLPGLSIHVARECSGIRSSLALMISGLAMAALFLGSAWTRAVLILVIVPLAVIKNGVRIVLLSWLAVYVDPSFITGSALHSRGGIPFFFSSLLVLAGLAWLLRRFEAKRGIQ